jgi:hypothetical protein
MKIKLKNLEKIIPSTIIGTHLSVNFICAKSELDAYYLTYYEVKDMFLKYKRSSFGDTTKNIKKVYELNYEDVLNEQLNNAAVVAAKELSSTYTNAYINNSIYGYYGYYNAYDSYATNLVVDYDGRLIGY